jgi:NAD(P)-dependent dehydrogenase (short-subunit alcohol dehydrogenase family)
MKLKDKVAVVTGGANGIGRAMCRRFAAEGARGVVVADFDFERAERLAKEIDGLAVRTNVAIEADIINLVNKAIESYGSIDVFCSNAGIGTPGGADEANDIWQHIWEVNVMAHIYAARHVLPGMLARGDGYIVATASAAGLLTQIGSAPYSVTKHAAVAFAEWLSITHGDAGIRVSCLCPQGVNTDLLRRSAGGPGDFLRAGALEPEDVAEAVVKAIDEERFLILPHPEVAEYFRRKATDYDRWLRGMRRLQASMNGDDSGSARQ